MSVQMNENIVALTATTASEPYITKVYSGEALRKYYPWLVITLCSLFLFYKYVLQVSPSVMTQDLMAVFHLHGAGLGNLAATYFYAYLITQLFVGPLLDRYSTRYFTTLAILLCAVGALLFAYTDSLSIALLARAFMGAGTAFATVSYMKMSSIWFDKKHAGFVDGLLATAAMLGCLCGQVPLNILVTQSGWRNSLIFCGLFGLVFAVIFFLMIRDNKKSAFQSIEKAPTLKWADITSLLRNKNNWLLAAYSGLVFTPITVLGGLWGNPFFEVSHHLTSTEAAYFTSLIFVGLAFGSPLFGFLAGRFGNSIKIMTAGTSIAFVALFLAIYVISLPLWLFGTLLFIFGLGTGVFILGFSFGKEINPLRLAATVVALINTGEALLGSLTEPLIGKLLDLCWDGTVVNQVHYFSTSHYFVALSLLPIYLLLAVGCLVLLKK